jgi:hypothetical protein
MFRQAQRGLERSTALHWPLSGLRPRLPSRIAPLMFCRLRTFVRSPAVDAVKIRCRNRRMSSSTRRQSTAC